MTVQMCSCEGLNPNCNKCFGSGYMNSPTSKKSAGPDRTPIVNKTTKRKSFLPENIKVLSRKEVETIAEDIIASLDLKSKKQMQLLNSIPFNTTTFRRDSKEKFESLETLENEKQQLRNELFIIDQEIISKKYPTRFKFKHFLSDKDIDVTSNRQLKDLIREYKKLKDAGPQK